MVVYFSKLKVHNRREEGESLRAGSLSIPNPSPSESLGKGSMYETKRNFYFLHMGCKTYFTELNLK